MQGVDNISHSRYNHAWWMDVFIAYHLNVLIYFHFFYLCIVQVCYHLLVSMGIFISGFSKISESTDYPDPCVKSYSICIWTMRILLYNLFTSQFWRWSLTCASHALPHWAVSPTFAMFVCLIDWPLLCSPRLPQTCSPPASAPWVLILQAFTIKSHSLISYRGDQKCYVCKWLLYCSV